MSVISKLKDNGFLLLKNVIPQHIIINMKNQISKTHVNYTQTHEYTKLLMHYAGNNIGTPLTCTKYRVSNNNNSTDAASFHRDLQIHNPSLMKVDPPNVFTILSYLDETVMQLIPGSHKKNSMSMLSAMKQFKNHVELKINPGDILIFYATTIHRGIFYKKQENRRLIQCFDCIPKNEINLLSKQILHLPCYPFCNKSIRTFFKKISRVKYLIEPINYINYLNVACGYGYQWKFVKKYGYTEASYISTESNNGRLHPALNNSLEPINKYIILTEIIDAKPQDSYKIKRYYATANILQFYFTLILICIIIFIVVLLILNIKKMSAMNI